VGTCTRFPGPGPGTPCGAMDGAQVPAGHLLRESQAPSLALPGWAGAHSRGVTVLLRTVRPRQAPGRCG
jgi:hypothetical protein